MGTFSSPARYRNGRRAGGLALGYLLLVVLMAVGAALDLHEAGTADGSFWFNATLVATLPLSLLVVLGSLLAAMVRGVPMAEQDANVWVVAAFVVCAVLDALAIWALARGPRVDQWDGSRRA